LHKHHQQHGTEAILSAHYNSDACLRCQHLQRRSSSFQKTIYGSIHVRLDGRLSNVRRRGIRLRQFCRKYAWRRDRWSNRKLVLSDQNKKPLSSYSQLHN
ncbi:hypothetical protein T03_3215, partial [Trichinella britovi]